MHIMASKVTAACVVAVMMMMMMMMLMTAEAAAMPRGHSKVETIPLQLDLNAIVPSRNIRALENASISPWTYNVSHDTSLFPPLLSEARCLLQGCLNADGLEDLSLESRPIMQQVLVLRRVGSARTGDHHGYHFRLESRVIAVGCTCIRPIIQHQE